MKLHLFNPENDLALGLGCRNYTPPPHAAALHSAGQLLPLWWADKTDGVVSPGATSDDFDWLRRRFGLACRPYESGTVVDPTPWGWSLDARRQFAAAGVPSQSLPDNERIETIRRLSHRRQAVRLLESVGYDGEIPIVTDSADEAMDFVSRHDSCYVKSPWSGSGRGVFNTAGLGAEALRTRFEGIIHRQGDVIVEPALHKLADFAALYRITGHETHFEGLSVFETEPRGMYVGNLVASQHEIAARIEALTGGSALTDTVGKVGSALGSLLHGYDGPVGVDMMVYDRNGQIAIMPCVEINLRMTMGFVAASVAEKLNVTTGRFIAWRRGVPPEGAITLLPPVNEFSLTLI